MHARRLAVLAVGALCGLALLPPAAASAAFAPLGGFGSYGSGAGQFTGTGGLAIAASGSIYQAGYGDNRIAVYSPQGGFLFAFGDEVAPSGADVCDTASGCQEGNESGNAGGLDQPEAVALDAAGNVFVADYGNNRVSVFSAAGEFLFAFGKDVNESDGSDVCDAASGCDPGAESSLAGGFDNPSGVAVAGGAVFVADSGNARISVFSLAGGFLYAFGKEVKPGGGDVCTEISGCQSGEAGEAAGELDSPADVASVPGGLLAIAENRNRRVAVFTEGGSFVRGLGAGVNVSNGSGVCTTASGCREGPPGAGAGTLGSPVHLTFDRAGGVYVGDTELERVSQFDLGTGFVRAFGAGVVDGAAAFQVCTAICAAGLPLTIAGATPNPYGLAVAGDGTVLVAEEGEAEKGSFARIERFGDLPAPPLPDPPAAPSNKFRFGKLKLNEKAGTATLTITVPGAGSAVLKGNGIKKVKRTAKKAGKLKLPVKLKGKAKEKLLEQGRSAVSAKVTFTPKGGKALTKQKRMTLKKRL
ncbi:MAG: tripartite motif-containing protein 71 [Solirubrobacterales bacterium]|jgi:DNA-binding beta-propeller fold protein YncE|nr:tripartite motif-containing protein 71 [Solirubrobacterales bacterium]